MTVDLRPEVEAQLRAEARRLLLAPEQLAARLLAQQLDAVRDRGPVRAAAQPAEDWYSDAMGWVAEARSMNRRTTPLPDEALSRESMYEDEALRDGEP